MESNNSPAAVHLATKRDCYDLKLFLEHRLPQSCDIYHNLVALLTTPGDTTKFYFTRRSDGTYGAIVGLRQDCAFDEKKRLQNVWLSSTWFDDSESLVRIFRSVECADWTRDGFVAFFQTPSPLEVIKPSLIGLIGEFDVHPIFSHYVDMETALTFNLETDDDVYIKSLEPRHAAVVYQHWRYNYTTTVENVARQIDRLPSAGVFLKQGDKLVSWIMSHPPNGMSRLYTLDDFRRRGYAALTIKYISKRMVQSGYLPFANIEPGNEASLTLFRSLGFKQLRWGHVATKNPSPID